MNIALLTLPCITLHSHALSYIANIITFLCRTLPLPSISDITLHYCTLCYIYYTCTYTLMHAHSDVYIYICIYIFPKMYLQQSQIIKSIYLGVLWFANGFVDQEPKAYRSQSPLVCQRCFVSGFWLVTSHWLSGESCGWSNPNRFRQKSRKGSIAKHQIQRCLVLL